MQLNPDEPESFFKMYYVFEDRAEKLRETLINDVENESVDTIAFFNQVSKRQDNLTKKQELLHKTVVNVEKKWKDNQANADSHQQYTSAVKFFEENEQAVQDMTQEMQKLSEFIGEVKKPK